MKATVCGRPWSGEEFDRIEAQAMRFAGSVGLTADDVAELNTISRLFHGAAWDTENIQSTFLPSQLRLILQLLRAKPLLDKLGERE